MADQNEPKRARLERPYAGRRSMQDQHDFTNSDAGKEMPVLCRQIRFFRERKGIEQKELAARVGIKSNAVSNWENGRTRPDIALLPKICQVLGVTIDELFDLPVPESKTTFTVTHTSTAEDDHLLQKYRQLNKWHRSVVDAMIDKLGEVEDQELYDRITEKTAFSKQLAAGYDPGLEFDDEGEVMHLYRDKIHPSMDCVFTVSGDSMEPDFHDGDRVMIQRLEECSDLDYGEIGAFIFGNETYIKEYRKNGLRSLNRKYKLMRFNEDDSVYIIGRVLGVLDPDAIVSFEDVQRYERIKQGMEEESEESDK